MITPVTGYAAITDWREVDTPTFPTVDAYTFDVNTSCGSKLDTHLDAATHAIFLPDNPANVNTVMLYFHGNGNYSFDQFCSGRSANKEQATVLGACHAIAENQNAAVIALTRPSSITNSDSWFSSPSSDDVSCLIEQLREVTDRAGINNSVASMIYAGWSGGGGTIKNLIPYLPASNVALFDACYANWCEQIMQSSNAREVFFYYDNDGDEITRAKRAIELNTQKATGFLVDASHNAIPAVCALDIITGGAPCYGKATRDSGGGTDGMTITAGTVEELRLGAPDPQIKIPGLAFSAISNEALVREGPYGSRILSIPFLGEYIVAVFRYSMGVLTVLAGIAIIIGGIMYMTSGASNDTARAKQVITNALVAVVLASTSYLILTTINPELIRIRNLEIPLVEPIYLDDESLHPVEIRGRGELPSNFSPPSTGPVADSLDYANNTINPLPELLGQPQPPFPACSREAAQWTAKELDALNICVGPCHCAYTASHFLNFIGCTIPYSGGANNLTQHARSNTWTEYDSPASFPDDVIGLLSKKGDSSRIVHVGIYLGADLESGEGETILQFDSGYGGGLYRSRVGNMCPSSRWFWDIVPNDPHNNCYECSRIPAQSPASGRFGSAGLTPPGSAIQGTNSNEGCRGIQLWVTREFESDAWDYLNVPSGFIRLN